MLDVIYWIWWEKEEREIERQRLAGYILSAFAEGEVVVPDVEEHKAAFDAALLAPLVNPEATPRTRKEREEVEARAALGLRQKWERR